MGKFSFRKSISFSSIELTELVEGDKEEATLRRLVAQNLKEMKEGNDQ